MERIIVVKLDRPIPCQNDVVGKIYKIIVDNIPAELILPDVVRNESPKGNHSLSVRINKDIASVLNLNEDICWGQVHQSPTFLGYIERILIKVDIVDSDDYDIKIFLHKLESWISIFGDVID